MLVKINSIESNKVYVTQLDIDDYGSLVPLKDLELVISTQGKEIYNILKSAPFAAVFTRYDIDNDKEKIDNTILLANPISIEELNLEKQRIIDDTNRKNKE